MEIFRQLFLLSFKQLMFQKFSPTESFIDVDYKDFA